MIRFGAWRTSQIALICISFSHVMFMGGSLILIAFGSALLGWAYGLITPAASHLLSKVVTPGNRNLIFSIRFTGVPIGGMLAGLIAPPIALQYGWQESMSFTITVAIVLCAAMHPFREKWDADRSKESSLLRNPISDLRLVWSLTALRWIALYGLCMGAIQTTLTTYTVTMLVEDIGHNLITAGIGLSIIQFSSIFGRVGWGWFADKTSSGTLALICISLIAGTCAIATFFLSTDWPHVCVYALCFMFGLAGMGWDGVYASEIVRLSPKDEVSRTTGASFFITFSGVFFGPVTFAYIYSITQAYNSTFMLTAVIAAFAYLLIRKAQRANTLL